MLLEVNGDPLEVAAGITLAELLAHLEIDALGVALAVNQTVVPRSSWEKHILQEQDHIELFQSIAGG